MVRVLVVDDEPAIADALGVILRDEGYEVERAADGCTALAKLSEWRPDVILSDLTMPHMGGEELLHRLRQMHDFSHIPIVAMSALTPSPGVCFDGFLKKPFSMLSMLAVIAQAASRRSN